MTEELLVDTPQGPARLHIDAAQDPGGLLVLGHSAGGSITAPDLRALATVAPPGGVTVIRIEQPYLVAGRRSPVPAPQLDEAWVAAVAAARERTGSDVPLVVGGRSSGARVAARTIQLTRAVALLALAFPLVNPRGVSRQPELDAVGVPVLILQGDRDQFGMPAATTLRRVHVLASADHSLRGRQSEIVTATLAFLAEVLGRDTASSS